MKILIHAICNRDLTNVMPIITNNIISTENNKFYLSLDHDEYLADKNAYKTIIDNYPFFNKAKQIGYNIYGNYDYAIIIAPYGFDDYYKTWLRLKKKGCKLIYLDYGSTVLKTWINFRNEYMSTDKNKQMMKNLINTVDTYIGDFGDIEFYKKFYKEEYKKNKSKFVKLNTSIRLFDKDNYISSKHNGKNILVSLRVPRSSDKGILNGLSFEIVPRMLKYAMDNPNINVYFRIHACIETSFHQTIYWYSKKFNNIHFDNTEYDSNLSNRYDIFKNSDIIISDYSSILYEYTSYNKPIICVDTKNEKNYTKDVSNLMYFCKPENIENFLYKFKETNTTKKNRQKLIDERFKNVELDKDIIRNIFVK